MINVDISRFFAHHLLAGAGLFRHEDQDVPFHLGDTTQPVARLLLLGIDIFILFLLPGTQM